jgi:hypothetical protein
MIDSSFYFAPLNDIGSLSRLCRKLIANSYHGPALKDVRRNSI